MPRLDHPSGRHSGPRMDGESLPAVWGYNSGIPPQRLSPRQRAEKARELADESNSILAEEVVNSNGMLSAPGRALAATNEAIEQLAALALHLIELEGNQEEFERIFGIREHKPR